MRRTLRKIEKATAQQLGQFLNAVLQRYAVLYPDWEISTVSLQKSADRNEQIQRIIRFLEAMKETQ